MALQPKLCNAEDSLLVIVDMQSRLSAAMPKANLEEVLVNSIRIVEAASILKIPVLLTEQYPKGLGPTETNLARKLPEKTLTFDKTGFSCCAANGFVKVLKDYQRQQIILIGQETHVCILQTALELLDQDFQVFVVEDAVISRKAEHKLNAVQRMLQQGAVITNYESVLFEWLKDASHPDFKAVSGLLR